MLRPTWGPPAQMGARHVWAQMLIKSVLRNRIPTLPNIDDLVGVEQVGETLDDADPLLAPRHSVDEHEQGLAVCPAQE